MGKRCTLCLILEDRSIGIIVGEDNICNLCKRKSDKYEEMSWEEKKAIFDSKLDAVRGKYPYEGLLMMSGGKDSAYLALTLKREYKLNIKGIIIDNSYEYPDTFENVKSICKQLEIPLIIYQPNIIQLRNFYNFIITDPKLRRDDFGQICFYCGVCLKRIASDFAKAFNIPYIFSGYNPDQIYELGDAEITQKDNNKKKYQQMVRKAVDEKIIETENYVKKSNKINFLPFLRLPETPILYYYQHVPYYPLEMIELIKKELNWKPIQRFNQNYIASGCQLATILVNLCRIKDKPDYIQKEFSAQIRRGSLDKNYVLSMFNKFEIDYEEIEYVLGTLGLTKDIVLKL